MEYNQLKQCGVTIHEDTPDTSTPVAQMIPSVIDAQYAKLFLAAPDLYEACKQALRTFEAHNIRPTDDRYRMLGKAIAKVEGKT